MDFSLSPDQDDLKTLAARILGDRCTPEHLKAIEATPERTDTVLWASLAEAGLVGIGLPESVGGAGLGFIEICVVLEEVARVAAPVPALATMVLGALPLVWAERTDLLDGVASGDVVLTAALHEPVGDVRSPFTSVDDGRITGTKVCVPAGAHAARFVVSAADGLYVVERDADGVLVEAAVSTAGHLEARITFDGAPAARLGGLDLLDKLLEHGATACAVMMAGVCERALQLTADYTKTRVQFERPIASFQAVSQRAADAYIDTEAVRLTAWQAAWRLHEGLPSAEQVATAKYWASEGGQRVVAAAHHLHGGMGVDRDYPLHRCFLWAKQLELSLGSAMPSLVRLGKLLAAAPG